MTVLGLVGALAWLPNELVPTSVNLAAVALGIAVALGAFAARQGRRHRRRDRKVSEELDVLSRRLVAAEARLAAVEPPALSAGTASAKAAGDLAALSEAVNTLAEALSVQDRELVTLRRIVDSSAAALSRQAEAPPMPHGVVPSFLPDPSQASPRPDLPRTRERGDAIDPVAIMSALSERQIDFHVQPIVTLPQRRAMVHDLYPLLRLRNGEVLVPGQFLPTLDRLGLTADLDEQVVLRAIETARSLAAADRDGILACGLSRRSLSDPKVLARIESLLSQDTLLASRLVIEVAQSDWPSSGAVSGFVSRLRDRSIGFALGKVTELPTDPAGLAAAGIRYVKIQAARLYDPNTAEEPVREGELLSDRLAGHGIRLVAERVEDEAIVPELIELGVPLAQGFTFALPAPIASLLASKPVTAAKPAKPVEQPAEPTEPPEPTRRPLRSFLRRAG